MSRMFDEMPEELKRMLGISPTDLTREEKEFDYDNPPLTCEEIPDSVIPAEALKKLIEVRKLIIEAKDLCGKNMDEDSFAFKMATASPYVQFQWLIATDEMQDALQSVNTVLHINDTGEHGIKSMLDEEAHKHGILVKDLVRKALFSNAMSKILNL